MVKPLCEQLAELSVQRTIVTMYLNVRNHFREIQWVVLGSKN